jgi:hypothetical protein
MRRTREPCPTCGNTLRWWRSRRGRRVCMVCHPDPLEVLGTLRSASTRTAGPVRQVAMVLMVRPPARGLP